MSLKASLSPFQIDDICKAIPINMALPLHIRLSMIKQLRTRLSNDLEHVKIYPEMYLKFKDEIVKYYYKTLADSGTAVGIQCAQSIGERQTQSTLNTFHSAGLSVKTVVVGVPRFSELLNATKSPKMVNCLVYLNEEFNDVSEVRKRSGNMFTDITLKRLLKASELIKDDPLEDWHHFFCDVYDINPACLGWRLRLTLDTDALYEYKVTMKMISQSIMNEYHDATVLYTPEWKGIVDVFVNESCFNGIEKNNICDVPAEVEDVIDVIDEIVEDVESDIDDLEEDVDDEKKSERDVVYYETKQISTVPKIYKEDVVPEDIDRIIHMEDKVLPALNRIHICGIEGIKDIFFEKRKDEWIITTEGSNLYGLFNNPLIDKTKTMCNDMWEIYSIFGIEAVRQFLVEEYMDVVSSDGTYVNPSNVELLVDIMVYTGTIISISRYGQKKVGCGPMAKASFEESLENFLKAGVNGEKESTNGVSASIMLGKMPNTGTGVFDMMIDVEKILSTKPVKMEDKKERCESHEKCDSHEFNFSKKNSFFDISS
jgi:DNA-directed RNA polymerase II subunit RPB1